jgi:Flp pilus assembly pilin Flp
MNTAFAWITAWRRHVQGATAIEYTLIAAGISTVIVAVVFLLGGHLSDIFDKINSGFGG